MVRRVVPALLGVLMATAGFAAVVYGVYLVFEPAAWLVGGAGVMAAGLSLDVGS